MIQTPLPEPLADSRFGLIAWGRSAVEFHDFRIQNEHPQAFVVMQFGAQYDALYGDVIAPIYSELGFEARRADDVFGPGIVLENIISGLREAAVVIAEISPVNANVRYELGYAHAISKPTILLAQRGQPLPFDVQGYRCIFYDDSIAGKQRVEGDLRRHLASVI